MDKNSVLRALLSVELQHTKLWIASVALRDVRGDGMSFEQRDLAFQAKDAAATCLEVFLTNEEFKAAIRYAMHEVLAQAVFVGLFLLKMVHLYPTESNIVDTVAQVKALEQILEDACVGPYSPTLRYMLGGIKRRFGNGSRKQGSMGSLQSILTHSPGDIGSSIDEILAHIPSSYDNDTDSVPDWIKDGNITDIGLPENGIDGTLILVDMQAGGLHYSSSLPEAR